MKLSKTQIEAIKVLRKYPSAIVMLDGYLTGGHGIRLDKRTINALHKNKLLTFDRRISELGKTIELNEI